MVRSQRSLAVLCAFLAVVLNGMLSSKANAQPPAWFSSLSNGATEVSVTPEIAVRSHYHIDSLDVPWGDIRDSTSRRTVMVIPKAIYDTMPDSTWYHYAAIGTYHLENDTTLIFQPVHLKGGSPYVAVLDRLYVDSAGQTLQVSPCSPISFTTVFPPYQVTNLSLFQNNRLIRTGDTISIKFNRKLDSLNTPAGALLELDNLAANFDTSSGQFSFADSGVSFSAWINPADSTEARLRSTVYNPGSTYRLQVHTSRLTGDSTDDIQLGYSIKDRYKLSMSTQGVTLPHYFFPSDTVMQPCGDSVVFTPPAQYSGMRFDHWFSTEPGINGSMNSRIVLRQTCAELHDVMLSAVYVPDYFDSIILVDSSPASGSHVRVDLPDTSIDEVSGAWRVERGSELSFNAFAPTGYYLDHWYSTDSRYNGSNNEKIWISDAGPSIRITPIYKPKPSGLNDYYLCGKIDFIGHPNEYSTDPPLNNIALIVLGDPCYDDNPTPLQHNVQMKDNYTGDWGLRYDYDMKDGVEVAHDGPFDPPQDLRAANGNVIKPETSSKNPNTTWHFELERFKAALIFEIAMEDGSQPDSKATKIAFPSAAGNKEFWVTVSPDFGTARPVAADPWQNVPGKQRDQWTFTYWSHLTVNLSASTEAGYEFVGWYDGAGYVTATTSNMSVLIDFPTSPESSPKKVRAIFRKVFKLEAITVNQDFTWNQNAEFIPTGYNADKGIPSSQGGWGEYQREIGFTSLPSPFPSPYSGMGSRVQIVLKFSDPVDENTLWQNAWIYQLQEAINSMSFEGYGWGVYPCATRDYTNLCFSKNANLSADKKSVYWDIVNQSTCFPSHKRKLPKLMEFKIDIGSGIKSTLGTNLSNPGSYLGFTINPDVRWSIDWAEPTLGCSWSANKDDYFYPDVELFGAGAGSVAYANGGHDPDIHNVKFPESGDIPELGCFETHTFNTTIIQKYRIRDDAIINFGLQAWDQDGSNVWNKAGDIIQRAGEKVAKYLLDNEGIAALDNPYFIAAIVTEAVGYFFQNVSNNDDNLGQIYTHDDQVGAGTMSNYWGWKINNKDMWSTDYYTKDCQGAWKMKLKVDLQ